MATKSYPPGSNGKGKKANRHGGGHGKRANRLVHHLTGPLADGKSPFRWWLCKAKKLRRWANHIGRRVCRCELGQIKKSYNNRSPRRTTDGRNHHNISESPPLGYAHVTATEVYFS